MTQTAIVPQEVQVEAKRDAVRLTKMANEIVVTSKEQEEFAYELLINIKKGLKTIESQRKKITKPLNDSLKEVNGMFKMLAAPFKDADKLARDKIMEFRLAEEEKAQKEQERREKIQASHEKKGHQTHDLAEVEPEVASETVTVKRWVWEVVDLNEVPREFFSLNQVAVNTVVREGARDIAGLRIYQEEKVRV